MSEEAAPPSVPPTDTASPSPPYISPSGMSYEVWQPPVPKKIGEPEKESCVPLFDALWFCYSPVYQMKEYYVYNTVDTCVGHWGKLVDCLKRKTTLYKEDAPPDLNAGRHPVWQLRTKEEAEHFWMDEFNSQREGSKEDPVI